MEDEQKKKKYPAWLVLIIRLFEIVIAAVLIVIVVTIIAIGVFSYNLKGDIRVSINGEIVEPENIVCYRASDESSDQKLKTHWKEEYYFVKAKAVPKDRYFFEFDVDTIDGQKHFIFSVFKSKDGVHEEKFDYELNLNIEDGKWVAYVSLSYKDGNNSEVRILLEDDPNAYVLIGP